MIDTNTRALFVQDTGIRTRFRPPMVRKGEKLPGQTGKSNHASVLHATGRVPRN